MKLLTQKYAKNKFVLPVGSFADPDEMRLFALRWKLCDSMLIHAKKTVLIPDRKNFRLKV
jgi:hypothetical protein